MLDITSALEVLKAGHSIQRADSQATGTSYFLKNEDGKDYLYVRQTRSESTDVVEEPTAFDWEDLIATDWEKVETTTGR